MSLPALIDKRNTSKFGPFTTEEIIRAGAYAHRTLSELSAGDPAMLHFLREFQTFQGWIGAKIELGYTPVEPCLVFSHNAGLTPKIAEECRAVAECYGGQVYFSKIPKSIILKGAAAVKDSDAWKLATFIKTDIRGTSMMVSEFGIYSTIRDLAQ